jgi:adenosylmethionine-8-amino-7-oxononanoate aminotransferase
MTDASDTATTLARTQQLAKRHLWMNFTHLGTYEHEDVPIIVRGAGCHVWDDQGRRYFDGLSGLYCVNAGHGRPELRDAATAQLDALGYYPTWSAAHPPAVELAARIAELAPGSLNRVLFTSGGSESVDTAIKLARQYHAERGEGRRTKVIARDLAYHGVTLAALSATGVTMLRTPFEPLVPGFSHIPNTNAYRRTLGLTDEQLIEATRARIEFEDPSTIAALIVEPVQNAGGCFVPPEGYLAALRALCDEHGILLICDEVICAWGRLGEWFGCQRYGVMPDVITVAKGLTSGYAPMGAVIASDAVAEPFTSGGGTFMHGFTFSGHPLAAAIALANIDVIEREDLLGNVRRNEGALRAELEALLDVPIVGDVRGAGYFWALELVREREGKAMFSPEQCQTLLYEFLTPELNARGLLCRADNRGEPVLQLAPPLTAGPDDFREIASILRPVLEEAAVRIGAGATATTR